MTVPSRTMASSFGRAEHFLLMDPQSHGLQRGGSHGAARTGVLTGRRANICQRSAAIKGGCARLPGRVDPGRSRPAPGAPERRSSIRATSAAAMSSGSPTPSTSTNRSRSRNQASSGSVDSAYQGQPRGRRPRCRRDAAAPHPRSWRTARGRRLVAAQGVGGPHDEQTRRPVMRSDDGVLRHLEVDRRLHAVGGEQRLEVLGLTEVRG